MSRPLSVCTSQLVPPLQHVSLVHVCTVEHQRQAMLFFVEYLLLACKSDLLRQAMLSLEGEYCISPLKII